MSAQDTHTRSLVKSIVWRIVVIVSDSFIVYNISHRWDVTASFVTLTNISSTLLYYGHERVWNNIKWGRKKK